MTLFSRNCCVVGGDLKSYLYRAAAGGKFWGFQQKMLRKMDDFSVGITQVFAEKSQSCVEKYDIRGV